MKERPRVRPFGVFRNRVFQPRVAWACRARSRSWAETAGRTFGPAFQPAAPRVRPAENQGNTLRVLPCSANVINHLSYPMMFFARGGPRKPCFWPESSTSARRRRHPSMFRWRNHRRARLLQRFRVELFVVVVGHVNVRPHADHEKSARVQMDLRARG